MILEVFSNLNDSMILRLQASRSRLKRKLEKRVARQECIASESCGRRAVSDRCPPSSGSGGKGLASMGESRVASGGFADHKGCAQAQRPLSESRRSKGWGELRGGTRGMLTQCQGLDGELGWMSWWDWRHTDPVCWAVGLGRASLWPGMLC